MKQSQVAAFSGTTRSMLCNYKAGKQAPRVQTLSAILETLRFTYGDLEEAAAFVEWLKTRQGRR